MVSAPWTAARPEASQKNGGMGVSDPSRLTARTWSSNWRMRGWSGSVSGGGNSSIGLFGPAGRRNVGVAARGRNELRAQQHAENQIGLNAPNENLVPVEPGLPAQVALGIENVEILKGLLRILVAAGIHLAAQPRVEIVGAIERDAQGLRHECLRNGGFQGQERFSLSRAARAWNLSRCQAKILLYLRRGVFTMDLTVRYAIIEGPASLTSLPIPFPSLQT